MATKKAKVKVSAKVTIDTDLKKIGKLNESNARKGVKQFYTDNGAEVLIATLAKVTGGKDIIPTDLRIASKGNAQARRQWCVDNNAPKVDWLTVQKPRDSKGGKPAPALRPDNAIRARVFSLKGRVASAKKVGYIRVLDAYTAKRNPTHPDCQKVYVYRLA